MRQHYPKRDERYYEIIREGGKMYVGPKTVPWQHPSWPNFKYDEGVVGPRLAASVAKNRAFLGRVAGYGLDIQDKVMLSSTTDEIMRSSQIEGVSLTYKDVLQRVAMSLGLNFLDGLGDYEDLKKPQSVADIIIDARRNYRDTLSMDRLYEWHRRLFPGGSDCILTKISVGSLRDGPMMIVSGRSEEFVEYNAPPPEAVPGMMAEFLDWFNSKAEYSWLVKGAEAHLRFALIHPFDDGNGRIARAIAVMALARENKSRNCFYSMSDQFCKNRTEYCCALRSAQNEDMDMTEWLGYYLDSFDRAIDSSEYKFRHLEAKAELWRRLDLDGMSEADQKYFNAILDSRIRDPKAQPANITVKSIKKRMRGALDAPEKIYEDFQKRGLVSAVQEFHSRQV